ncbi:SDR family NAD(P)-dependent oxidoreductase [Sphingomonas cannabina]|uniref:SDR family NAD(P)-dependent oxidoreductase n=1 Tax=Sphingomonas cannabina TaxID=2899123 RepID=UPI001F43F031|nr:SDR family NAD(P)-dependent oxidoreductase [Sphingomonas cannabina]UIJ44847.1 SDR family NAD(P)-dependent oxidoreductase [Sphingomonas cannabina]
MADKFAIVTGASSGIGLEIARIAARDGYDLLVAADTPLADTGAQLRAEGTNIATVETDLATLEGVDRLLDAAAGRPVDVLVANAGTGQGGAFLDQQVARWRHVIDTNITGTIYLLQQALRPMVARDAGKVLVTGSIAGYIPGSFNAVYNATKAFLDNFTEALRNELKGATGVTLTTLMPGPTDTEFFARADMLDTEIGQAEKADPAEVARDGWEALMAGKGHVVSGLFNKLQVAGSGVMPQSVLAEMHRKQAKPHDA